MEVLKAIPYGGQNATPHPLDDPCKSSSLEKIIYDVVDSDDEDVQQARRNQFGQQIAAFCFTSTKASIQQSSQDSDLPLRLSKQIPAVKEGATREVLLLSDEDEIFTPDPIAGPSRVTDAEPQTVFTTSLGATLRSFPNCPLCMEPFPILSARGIPTKRRKRKGSKPTPRSALTGPARLLHLQRCASNQRTPRDVVLTIVDKEAIRLDRMQRHRYNEEVKREALWKTVTGDAPPSTQMQQEAVRRGRRKPKNGGLPSATEKSPVKASLAFKTGKRGGLSRASTTILPAFETRAQVRDACVRLFGTSTLITQSGDLEEACSPYGEHDERTQRCRRAFLHSTTPTTIGLGVGACSKEVQDEPSEAVSRLTMGYTFSSIIAQRFKASD